MNNKAYNNELLEIFSKLILCAKILIKEGLNVHFLKNALSRCTILIS